MTKAAPEATPRSIAIRTLCRADAEERFGWEIRALEDCEARGLPSPPDLPTWEFLRTCWNLFGSWKAVLHVLEHGEAPRVEVERAR